MNDTENKKEDESTDDSATENPPKQPSPLEWAMAALGLALIFAVLGLVAYRGATRGNNPPSFSFEVTSVKPSGDKFLVTFKIKNTGDETAAAVNVEGELKRGGETIETGSATVTYVPSHSTREGGLLFSENPQNFSIEISPKGYEKP